MISSVLTFLSSLKPRDHSSFVDIYMFFLVIQYGNAGVSISMIIGPSGVRALPLAAGINVGGHYF